MIIIGGYDHARFNDSSYSDPDPWSQQINVFDMSALQWKDRYDSMADPYTPPDIVTRYYQK